MRPPPAEVTLELLPRDRFDVIDVTGRIADRYGDVLAPFPRALYCSFHTTAGYLDERLSARLRHDAESLRRYLRTFQELFPAGASYRHDQLDERLELSDEQRAHEPRNADSHLTFIGAGLQSCVSYHNAPDRPVFFVELDGVNGDTQRLRRSTVVGYHAEEVVAGLEMTVPVSHHRIDSVNLKDQRLGLFELLQEQVNRLEIRQGWVEIALAPDERNAGLTVNEFETLLMQHDLAEVLRNPVRFMAEKGRNMLRDPRAIPHKAKEYAKYDLVHLVNELVDALGLGESIIERVLNKVLAVPASHFLRMKRSVRLLVTDDGGQGTIVHGLYQSPILVQWGRDADLTRRLHARFVRLT